MRAPAAPDLRRLPLPPLLPLLLPILLVACAPRSLPKSVGSPIQVVEVAWRDAQPPLPAGAQVAVLEGNPREAGIFTMRLKAPAGSTLPRHRHATDERITVLSGTVCVTIETERCFPAGAYYVTPAGIAHALRFPEDTVLQATGLGPWTYEPDPGG